MKMAKERTLVVSGLDILLCPNYPAQSNVVIFKEEMTMATVANNSIGIAINAYDLAFRAGQVLQTLLLDRGAEFARQAGSSVITPEHVRASIDEIPIDQLRVKLDERPAEASGKAA
jgi:hypothetical protein